MTRVVVVTGGGTGIGRGVAEAFAAEGEQLVLVGRRKDVLDRTCGELGAAHPDAPPAVAVTADLAVPEQAQDAADAIAGRWDIVDVLVNSAGGNALLGSDGVPDGLAGAAWHWTENFRVNTLTAVLITEALKERLAHPGGRIVLVSSIAAYRGSGSGSYGAAKAALHPYAYDLAAELGPRGATVNVVAPGYIAGTEFFHGALSAAREGVLVAQTHTGRAGTPGDVADTVRWLASAAAGQVTGQIIQVNGGAERGR